MLGRVGDGGGSSTCVDRVLSELYHIDGDDGKSVSDLLQNFVLHQPLRLPGLTKAVSSLAKSGQARKAALAVRNSPINPDIKLINAAMPNQTACEAMDLYNLALSKGLIPDVYTFSSLITVLSREQRVSEACRMFMGMLRVNVVPDQHVVCSMITALRSYWKAAETVFIRCLAVGLDLVQCLQACVESEEEEAGAPTTETTPHALMSPARFGVIGSKDATPRADGTNWSFLSSMWDNAQDASGISSTLDFNLGSPERVPGLAAHAAGTGTGTGTPQDKASEGSQSQSPSRNSVELSPAGLVNGPHLPQTPVKGAGTVPLPGMAPGPESQEEQTANVQEFLKNLDGLMGELAAHQRTRRLRAPNVMCCNALLGAYSKCQQTDHAMALLDWMESSSKIDTRIIPDAISYNTVIALLARKGHAEQALHVYRRMVQHGVSPNPTTSTLVGNILHLRDPTRPSTDAHLSRSPAQTPDMGVFRPGAAQQAMARGARYSHGSRPTGAFPNASAAAAAAAAAAAPVPPPARGLPFPSHADQYRGYAGGSAHVMVTADGVPLPPGTGGAGFAGYQASGYMGPAGAYPSMVPEAGTDLYGAFPADSLLGPSSLLGFQDAASGCASGLTPRSLPPNAAPFIPQSLSRTSAPGAPPRHPMNQAPLDAARGSPYAPIQPSQGRGRGTGLPRLPPGQHTQGFFELDGASQYPPHNGNPDVYAGAGGGNVSQGRHSTDSYYGPASVLGDAYCTPQLLPGPLASELPFSDAQLAALHALAAQLAASSDAGAGHGQEAQQGQQGGSGALWSHNHGPLAAAAALRMLWASAEESGDEGYAGDNLSLLMRRMGIARD